MNLESSVQCALVMQEARELRVRLLRHDDNIKGRIARAYHRRFADRTFGESVWMTYYPHILFPDCIQDPWKFWPTIGHELVHARQQKSMGPTRWVLKYLASKKFRYEQEREAFVHEVNKGWRGVTAATMKLHSPLYNYDKDYDEIYADVVSRLKPIK